MSRVFIGRLPLDARESDVDRFMRGFGRIRDITLKRGYGFVEFDDYRDAEDAIDDLNGKEILGERVTLEMARGRRGGAGGGGSRGGGGGGRDRGGFSRRRPVWLDKYGPPVRTGYVAVVENLSSRTSWQDLKDYCRKAGKVTYADAHKRRVGEGIVEFSCREDLNAAISKLDDTELGGRRIRIIEDKNRDSSPRRRHSRSLSRSRSRSRSPKRRSRSRSKSRSRSRSPAKRSPRSRSKSPSRSRSRSYSRSPVARSRSRSPPMQNKDDGRDTD
ncbi:serine/arginine-rich splicing factor 6-like isoform X2 [Actinia tenebrosa]|uniref:Serine/arginine-rich splicing factor 6-like isoform X2 n=1 Tax=Actinia tenebrosa TaxID=6105 RepID=A0A6P8IU70_ACTTE|nr:serine/arginine-rich splicing factor 6-like isoform X2 [Actinia tenebrosa]